ncbi:MAG: sugar nucleotide-binding protein [Candidatus Aenigmarchaeota archaeon]|nr:sugar nucleotide-binding protein [Candidatus Aenigmarchaeota archaeon]
MKVLITGSTGRLGTEVAKLFPDALTPRRTELDASDRGSIYTYVAKEKPDVIIHLAALTGIPPCETNKELAWRTNVEGTMHLINACYENNKGCYFLYMSTPCVMDGKRGMYVETDIPNPENFYGLTKLLGEVVVLNHALKNRTVVRGNFVPKMKWPHPGAFTDRYGTYLFAPDLAKAIQEVVDARYTGMLHLVGQELLSMHQLAMLCPDSQDVKQMSYAEYLKNGGYRLTQNMSLDTIHKEWKRFRISK